MIAALLSVPTKATARTRRRAPPPTVRFLSFFFFFVLAVLFLHQSPPISIPLAVCDATTTASTPAFVVVGGGFVDNDPYYRRRRGRRPRSPRTSSSTATTTKTTTVRYATIYGAPPPSSSWEDNLNEWDWDDAGSRGQKGRFDDDDDDDDIGGGTSLFSSSVGGGSSSRPRQHPGLAAQLSQESVACLARLAAAFSPTGKLDLRSLEHVQVLDVDESHVDIEAVVCEGGNNGCLTLAIPVTFPHPCNNSDDDDDLESILGECVMGNLNELDAEATQVIRRLEWEAEHYEEIEAAKRELQALQNAPKQELHFPDWWSYRSDAVEAADDEAAADVAGAVFDACRSIRNILNEEGMQVDMKALATKSLSPYECYDEYVVDLAGVAAVCPTGMILRASAHRVQSIFDSTSADVGDNDVGGGDNNNKATMMVEIPIPFQERAESEDQLRANVLGTVMSAADFVEN